MSYNSIHFNFWGLQNDNSCGIRLALFKSTDPQFKTVKSVTDSRHSVALVRSYPKVYPQQDSGGSPHSKSPYFTSTTVLEVF